MIISIKIGTCEMRHNFNYRQALVFSRGNSYENERMLNILCKGRCHTLLEYIFLFLSQSWTSISLNCSLLALMTTNLLSVHFFFSLKLCAYENRLACENIIFSSLFAVGDVSSSRNVPSGEERGETDVFAGQKTDQVVRWAKLGNTMLQEERMDLR